MRVERPGRPLPGLGEVLAGVSLTTAVNALVAMLFAASAPVAIIIGVGVSGGLSQAELGSWIFAAFGLNGLLSLALSIVYRTPLAFFWTIPGAVLLGPAFDHLSFPEIVGAFHATGLVLLVLGLTGSVRPIMERLPMPIVMAMVAGVFLSFGLDWIRAVAADPLVAGPMTAVFFLMPLATRRVPPMLGVLAVGAIAVALSGRGPPASVLEGPVLTVPEVVWPVFSAQAMVELVVPLLITVLAAQNAQGFAVLKAAGHDAPVNAVTAACGAGTLLTGLFGAVPTCLTGPSNAILVTGGDRRSHYVAAVLLGLLALAFGLSAPFVIRVMLATPDAFVVTLAGLALLGVLQAAFRTAFRDRFTLGALVTFMVTVSGTEIFQIGAAFWGLVFGVLASAILERHDFRAAAEGRARG